MDENNLNPEINEAADNEQPAETAENPEIEAQTANENEESSEQTEIGEEKIAENEENASSSTEMELPPQGEAPQTAKKKKGNGGVIVLVVLIVLLIAAIGGLIYYIANQGSSNSAPELDMKKTVITVGDVESTVAEYYQFYLGYYSNYYYLSEDQLKDITLQQLVFTDSLYLQAIAEGYSLTEEDEEKVEAQFSSIQAEAESYNMSIDEYFEASLGKGYTPEMYREYFKKQLLAQKYYDANYEKLSAQFSAADVNAEYNGNKTDYDLSDVSYWYFDSTEENAQADADAVVEAVKGGTDFESAIKSVTGDSEAEPRGVKGITNAVIAANFSEEAANWIFAQNDDGSYVNTKGAVTTVEVDGVLYVLYVNNDPSRDENIPATLRYIRVEVDSDTSVKTEEELKLAAKTTATRIFDEFNATDKSIEAFESIVASCNENEDELVMAGEFDQIIKDGTNDENIEKWAFDEARQVGDCALIESDDCYYIVIYVSENENPIWYDTALQSLIHSALTEWEEEIDAMYKDDIVTNDDVIDEIIAYIGSLMA